MRDAVRRTLLQSVVLFIAAFGLITLAMGEGAYLYARHQLGRQLDDNMQIRMASLERAYTSEGRQGLIKRIDEYTSRGARTFGYVLTDDDGRPLKRLGGVPVLAPGWAVVALADHDERAVDPARTLTNRLSDGSTLTIVADRDFIEQYDAVTTGFICAALALLFLVAAGGALWLERTVRNRINQINDTARAIFAGNLDRRVPVSARGDEFDAIATTVNAMLDRLNALLGEVRRVSSYIAHDLRMPLVRLCDHLNRAKVGKVDMAAVEQCETIIRLFGAILRIGQIDSSFISDNAVQVDLSTLVDELGEAHVAVAEDSGRSLSVKVAPGIETIGDRDLLAQMLINLIDNALSHTPEGTHVQITLDKTADSITLAVADDGQGVDEVRRQRIGNDDALMPILADDREHFGLRLARRIALAHGGTFALEDNQPGLRVRISWPMAAQLRQAIADGAAHKLLVMT